ncbi:hypothetical protein Leryth_000086 [Lithospermum erythrorhizon]|nr:hypothetical protein Leryth_000086 [Lithospermum erythrorhizon]
MWWFHGPHNCHFMMKMLTLGNSNEKAFKFEPRSIHLIDECVIVEGWEGEEVYWVHVWSVEDGMITQFREYFNTWLIVKDGKPRHKCLRTCSTLWESNPMTSSSVPYLASCLLSNPPSVVRNHCTLKSGDESQKK